MSELLNAVLSRVGSFAVAYLVGSAVRDRRTGLRAGLAAATVAATVSWNIGSAVERAEGRTATATPGVATAGSD